MYNLHLFPGTRPLNAILRGCSFLRTFARLHAFKLMKQLLLIIGIVAHAFTATAQQWTSVLPTANCTNRHENALAAVKDKLILLGGRGLKPVESFDLKTGAWTKLADSPIEMHHFQAVAYNNEVWVLGAFTGGYPHETPIPNIHIFNPEKKEWRIGPEIPADRRRGAAAVFVYKNKVYIACGIQDGHWDGHVAWFDEYDPKTNQWKKLPDAPHVRDHVQAAVIGDRVYVAGGRRSTARINQVLNLTEGAVDIFDFKTGKWTTLEESLNLPTQRAGNACVAFDNKLLVIGGESGEQVPAHREVEAFNPRTLKWETLPPLKQGRHGTGAVNVNGKVYVVAGSGNRGGGPELNSIEVLEKK